MLGNIEILFIDDDNISQELIKAILSIHHDELCKDFSLVTIEEFYTAKINESVNKLLELKSDNNYPSIILSDIQLIEGTGFDFLDIYKDQFLRDYPKTVVALISAIITPEDQARLADYPFVLDIFVRPIEKKILEILIKEAIRRHS